ncbi:nucleoside-diphosphate-sugar epimerase [Renibacterium salmoninarum ATCC 33209]|uniref:Nucleoside-diphosphate-sugar epimerase n=1 Tax=Renibacterium salmoninarum (strain ATCC 33209 / DSM 20767 / JCM 11484 / NBRC 15589 / NCIMB 2235) TaxID=288705 RepID=A9WNZ7_RENSM|nr:nucleoside-diphosphate-sugar epimerase [Renibacterium salmoninarum ATCC 33209]
MVTPSSENAEQQQLRFIDAAIAAGVQHIVLLSQLGADVDSPVRFLRYHAVVEQRLEQLGIGYTFLRPNLFFKACLHSKKVLLRPVISQPRLGILE